MKTLVTGGAGFIGSHTVDLLLQQGHEVCVLDSLEPPVHQSREKPSFILEDVEFIQGDVRDRSVLAKALSGVEVVFHFAAYQDYLPYFSNFAFTNDGGTALLYEVIVNDRLDVRKVVLASSQAVYGEGKHECRSHSVQYPSQRMLEQLTYRDWEIKCPICGQCMKPLLTDECRVNPHNQYSISKYSQEMYALNLGKRYDIPTVALRYSITQGPRQSFRNAYSGILRTFALRILNGLLPVVYEDGKQLRDYVYVGDVAKANILAMESSEADFECFNVGGDKAITVLEYARILLNLVGKDIELDIGTGFRYGDTRHCISDITKLQRLGWAPIVPIEQIAQEYLTWVETQPGVADYYDHAAMVMREKGVIRKSQARWTEGIRV